MKNLISKLASHLKSMTFPTPQVTNEMGGYHSQREREMIRLSHIDI